MAELSKKKITSEDLTFLKAKEVIADLKKAGHTGHVEISLVLEMSCGGITSGGIRRNYIEKP